MQASGQVAGRPLRGNGGGKTRSAGASTGGTGPRRAGTLRAGRRGFKETLEGVFRGLTGFGVNTLGLEGHAVTYGEITHDGVYTLHGVFQALAPAPTSLKSGRPAVFLDIGSGIGRAVIGMAMLSPGLQSYGYEIVPDRVRAAATAAGRLKRGVGARVHFLQRDVLDPGARIGAATWVFVSNLCFSPETDAALAEKLGRELPAGAVVACSKELGSGGTAAAARLKKLDRVAQISMTWAQNSPVYLYRVEGAGAGTAQPAHP